MVPGAGIEPARLAARDFKSRTSTYFVIRAGCALHLNQLLWVEKGVLPDQL
ncbi:MAG: hypothetical protein RL133_1707 [Pseudomonadota bacterium]